MLSNMIFFFQKYVFPTGTCRLALPHPTKATARASLATRLRAACQAIMTNSSVSTLLLGWVVPTRPAMP